ncbi:flagellar basal body rod protein FlgC [Thermosulfurimonas sp. F29]|uniref:flagellar basal body rod protein FlgC n=1 Tax=Thermosulfurimonas sp. F29 TaxID=2867247 RepID=UPI001C829150|nr:flagellar basal body rod protein FlgC [Thermosulfurimonas sp. F29]MBX6423059.1 flagellar basal body rod protein FlgC [Thermosulfurimonas sp. F29]
MKLLTALKIAGSGLTAQRVRLNIASMNLANAQVTRTAEGGPYRAKDVILTSDPLPDEEGVSEVKVAEIVDDPAPFREVYDPTHPDADERGMVRYPNVDVLTEMVELLSAGRAYEANLTVINITKDLAIKTIDIIRG